jgi:GH25 family lysozyme M1 (1,4-beta-N-acetylmuramidase)
MFWVANYNEPAGHLLAGNVVIHQYSGKGSQRSKAFYGGNLDLNMSSLTVEDWRAFAQKAE